MWVKWLISRWLCWVQYPAWHYTHTTPHYTFSFASISSAVNFRFFYSVCSVSVVSDGVLCYCKSLYIILLWWFCVAWSRNGKVKPGRIEKRGIETKKELQVKPVTLFALQDGLEPTTPWLTVRCSNQLSYWSFEICASGWAWTNDPLINSQVL